MSSLYRRHISAAAITPSLSKSIVDAIHVSTRLLYGTTWKIMLQKLVNLNR